MINNDKITVSNSEMYQFYERLGRLNARKEILNYLLICLKLSHRDYRKSKKNTSCSLIFHTAIQTYRSIIAYILYDNGKGKIPWEREFREFREFIY